MKVQEWMLVIGTPIETGCFFVKKMVFVCAKNAHAVTVPKFTASSEQSV